MRDNQRQGMAPTLPITRTTTTPAQREREDRMAEARRRLECIELLNAEEAAVARLVTQYHRLALARQQAGFPHVVPAVDNQLTDAGEREEAAS